MNIGTTARCALAPYFKDDASNQQYILSARSARYLRLQRDHMGDIEEQKERIKILNVLIAIRESETSPYIERGVIYLHLGEVQRAIADFTKVIEIDKRHALAYANRGNCFNVIEQYEKAIADFNVSLILNPNLEIALLGRSIANTNLSSHQDSYNDLSACIILSPQSLSYS